MAKVVHFASQTATAQTWVAASTNYWFAFGGMTPSTTETNAQLTVYTAGTFSNLSIKIATNAVSSGTSTLQFRKNTANGNQVISITHGTTGLFQDTVNVDSVATNDVFNLMATNTASTTGTITPYYHSVTFDTTTPGTDTVTKMSWNNAALRSTSFNTASTTYYIGLYGTMLDTTTANTTENLAQACQSVSGTFKNLAVKLTTNSAAAAITCRFRKAAANGNQVISISAGTTGTFADTTHTDAVVSGNLVNISYTTGAGTATNTVSYFHVEFSDASSPGIGQYVASLTNTGISVAASGIKYIPLASNLTAQSTEVNAQVGITTGVTFHNLSTILSTNAATGGFTICAVRKNGVNTSVAISAASGTSGVFTDTTNTSVGVSGDLYDYVYSQGTGGAATIVSLNIYGDTVGLRNLTTTLSHTMAFVDSNTRLQFQLRPVSDSMTLTAAHNRYQFNNRPISSDSMTFAQTTNRLMNRLRPFSDSISFVDSYVKMTTRIRALSHSLTSVDSENRLKFLNRALSSDSISFTDSYVKLRNKLRPFADMLTSVDSYARLRSRLKTVSDSLATSSTMVSLRNKLRPFSNAMSLADSYVRLMNRLRPLSGSVSFTDSNIEQRNKIRPFSDSVSFTASFVREIMARIRTLSPIISLSDSYVRLSSKLRPFSDSITFVDTLATLRLRLRPLTNSITLIDMLDILRLGARTLLHFLTFVDTTTRIRPIVIRALSSDNMSFVDILSRIAELARSIGDGSVPGSDPADTSITISSTTGTFIEKDRTVASAISFASSIPSLLRKKIMSLSNILALTSSHIITRNKIRPLFSSPSDFLLSFTPITNIPFVRSLIRVVQDAVAFQDTVDNSGLSKARTLDYVISWVDSLDKLTYKNRSLTVQSISFANTFNKFRNKFQIINNASDTLISFTSNHLIFHNKFKLVNDNISINHMIDKITNKLRPIAYSLAIIASIGGSKLRSRPFADAITLSSTTAMIRGLWRTLANEAMTLTDSSYIKLTGRIRTLAHPLTIMSDHNRIKNSIRIVGQALTLASTHTMTRLRIRALSSDSISFTSSVSRLRMRVRTFTDSTTLTNVPTRMKNVLRSVSHVLPIISSLVNNVISPGPRNLWIRLITFRKG